MALFNRIHEELREKVKEELMELEEVIMEGDREKIEDEFGDLFFSVINAARLYDIDPETALERTNRKFIKRFKYLEEKTIHQGNSLKKMSLGEMNKIWEESKEYDDTEKE